MFSVYESLREGGCKNKLFPVFNSSLIWREARLEICLYPQASASSEKLDSCVGPGFYLIAYLITLSLEKGMIVLEK